VYDLAAIEAALTGTSFANKLHFSPVTGSTNSDAIDAARSGAPHGTVYLADEQTAGRGRGDHKWHSKAGEGLYVSTIVRPHISPERSPLISFAAGLAASEAIRSTSLLAVDLRWPNDLLVGPHKVGGILVESKIEAVALAYAVIGIGINVHQQEFDPALATPATSLDISSGRRLSRQALLIALLKSLEREVELLSQQDATSGILKRIEDSSTWLNGRRVRVHGPQECHGITAGLNARGFLLLQTDNGLVTVQTGGIRAAETE
jgi:BirA family biotin operon repressor/biotin-[acetyl-CoA-carboxylase] ligase